jgi:hypothetical protein
MSQVGFESTTFGFEVRDALDATTKSIKKLGKTQPALAAQGQRAASNDAGLTAVIEAWDRLRYAVSAGIVAIVDACSSTP